MCLCVILLVLVQMGADVDKGVAPWRLWLLENVIIKIMHYVFAISGGVINHFEYLDGKQGNDLFDYTYYLGPNWKKELDARTKRVSLVAVNHPHFYDAFMLVGFIPHVTYVAKE